ncbi:MAG: ABC transporter permease [Synergistaceae bacterium]|nr:ABC transporter permease [Synergistaceae bacterium]
MGKNKKGRAPGSIVTADPIFLRLMGIICVIVVLMSILRPGRFLTVRMFSSMAVQFPEYGLMAMGQMLAMITGGIDLSCVSIANLTGILCAMLLQSAELDVIASEYGFIASTLLLLLILAMGLCVGLMCGALNALFIHKFYIPPIMATIGTMALYKGIGLVLTGGKAQSGMPSSVISLGHYKFLKVIPIQVIIFIAMALILSFVMHKTAYGINIYLFGSNERGAVYAGMNRGTMLFKSYMLSGLFSAVAGLIMLATLNSAKADYGSSYLMLTILICVLGGVNPSGGTGKTGGVVLAAISMQLIASGMNMFGNLSVFYRNLVWGIVLIAVMVSNYYLNGRKD